jgi:anti-sigma factor RsiW
MTCSEGQLVAFLAGELTPEQSRRFDEHLLSCEACWRAVQEDRAARLALARVRQPAPSGLADRLALALEVYEDQSARAPSRRGEHDVMRSTRFGRSRRESMWRRRFLPAALGAVAATGIAAGLVLSNGSPSPMPREVAAVADIARPMSSSASLPHARLITVDGETMHLRFFLVDRLVVTVATARRPFPMMPAQDLERGSSDRSWLATMGNLGVFCMNHPTGGNSMLVVARMPAAELPAVAVRLHLI